MISEKDFIIRMLISLLIGVVIGFERQFRNRHAGIRTFAVLCMASSLIAMIALYSTPIFGSPNIPQILVAIIVGMGFLGSGIIYKEKEEKMVVHGLTTSTTLLMTAVIGIAIGIGYIFAGVTSAILTILCLVLLRFVEIKLKLKILPPTEKPKPTPSPPEKH
jgi:putative Mg2+ transporter-C (MgtC) family protein